MKAPELQTEDPSVRLIVPDIQRDAPLGVKWLEGESGRRTLHLMGVPDQSITASNLHTETERVSSFLTREDQLNWMIQYDVKVVGAVWADLSLHEGLEAPSIHIMIGDPDAREKGIGKHSMRAVIQHLKHIGFSTIYSRFINTNPASEKMLMDIGFSNDGDAYTDNDGLVWQNVRIVV